MKHILIIDDNEADQFYNEMVFEDYASDITLHKAYDGEEALAQLRSESINPDLILLDINMPGMNGHEFLEHWTEKNTREIPVIVMLTSSAQSIDKDKAMHYKCVQDYMVKPINDVAIAKLRELMG